MPMLRTITLLLFVGILASCANLEAQAKREKAEDRAACIKSGYAENTESFKQCMEYLDTQRAEYEMRTLQRDLNEYERNKQDRLIHHLSTPEVR